MGRAFRWAGQGALVLLGAVIHGMERCRGIACLGSVPRQRLTAACTSIFRLQGNAIIDPTAKIGKNCLIGPNVAIGKL